MPGFSKPTFLASSHTCRAIVSLTRYLLNTIGFQYVLMGKIQSDCIEERFGWIRQLSGANYLISLRQLMESDRKIRAISLLKFSSFTVSDIDKVLPQQAPDADVRNDACEIFGELMLNIIPNESDKAIVFYVSGACARSIFRIRKCDSCRESITEDRDMFFVDFEDSPEAAKFLRDVDRGGLLYPKAHVYELGILCWCAFAEMKRTPELRRKFLMSTNQRHLFSAIMDFIIGDNFEIYFGSTHCTAGHEVLKDFCIRFFNCMSKNFVKEESDAVQKSRKRKFDKFSGKI